MSDQHNRHDFPDAARIYDYLSGGTFHYPIDRVAGDYMRTLSPSLSKWLRLLRAFLQNAALRLANEGMTHFIDFGSGLPSSSHIHNVLPNAKVIYVDINPYVVEAAQKMVVDKPNILYLQGDVIEAGKILRLPEVVEFLGGEQRVAFGLSGISVFFSPKTFSKICRDLYDWAAVGSKVYTNYEVKDPNLMTKKLEQFIELLTQAGGKYRFYTMEDCYSVSDPWTLSEEGLVPLADFLRMPVGYIKLQDREGVNVEFYAAILEKK